MIRFGAVLAFLRDRGAAETGRQGEWRRARRLLGRRHLALGRPFFDLLAKGDIKKYSPVELIRRKTPPAVIECMGGDELVPVEIFHRLTNAYHRASVDVSASLTPKCNHGDMPRDLEANVVTRMNDLAVKTGLRARGK